VQMQLPACSPTKRLTVSPRTHLANGPTMHTNSAIAATIHMTALLFQSAEERRKRLRLKPVDQHVSGRAIDVEHH